jgi:HSP20 family molecular chaperone IbpA
LDNEEVATMQFRNLNTTQPVLIGILTVALLGQTWLLLDTRRQLQQADPGSSASQLGASENRLSEIEQRILDRLPPTPDTTGTLLEQWFGQSNGLSGSSLFEPLFDSFAGIPGRPTSGSPAQQSFTSVRSSQPSIQLEDVGDEYQVHLHIPDQQELALSTSFEDGSLRVEGTLSSKQQAGGGAFVFSSQSRFSREIPIPGAVNALGIYSDTSADSITIHLPKTQKKAGGKQVGSVS